MAQLFKPVTNYLSKLSIALGLLAAGAVGAFILYLPRSPFVTQQGVTKEQPVPFSHLHHVTDVGLDCRYCHTFVENSKVAGLPPSSTCMTCHSQLFRDSAVLAPVRESYKTGKPVPWVRVNDLPDFVYFDHSIHIKKGIGCASCHGRVDQMPALTQTQTLNMGWCLECHRNPSKNVRPAEDVFDTAWEGPTNKSDLDRLHKELQEKNHLQSLKDCSICHR